MIIKGQENPYLRGKPPKQYLSPAFSQFENPFDGMTEADRLAAIQTFAHSHAENFAASLKRLNELCRQFNFFQLLAHFAYYDQIVLDSEKDDDTYSPVEQNAAELLQALILQIPESDLQSKLNERPPPEALLEINKLLKAIVTSFSFKRFGSSGTKEKSAGLISEMMRTHTASVRNEGFASQVRRTMTEIVAPLDGEFEQKRGLRLTSLATMLWNLASLVEKRLNEDFAERQAVLGRKRPADIIEAFVDRHFRDGDRATVFRRDLENAHLSIRDLRGYLTTVWDHRNYSLFWLSFEDVVAAYPEPIERSVIEQLLTHWTIGLGELAADDPEHFFLDNPVWSRPFIRFGPDHLLLPIPALVQSFGRQLIERILQTEGELWEKYLSKTRPKYVEQFVQKLFSRAVPTGQIFAGVRWADPVDARKYETDLLIVHDAHALIVECKAGRISGRGRRGDTARLQKEIGRLIAEPTMQGRRFASVLAKTDGLFEFECSGGSRHRVDASRILRISRINVTLEYFGPVGVLARMLRESGLVPADLETAATVSMHELENVAEILDRPAFLFHYLDRRAEIETHNDVLGNEISLLSLYLGTGFDLGDFEGGELKALALPGLDKDLEPYFMGKELKRVIIKPKRRFTGWWNDMLRTVEERAVFGWTEISHALLSVGHERQRQFERGVKKMLKEVKTNWREPNHRNVVYMIAGSPVRRVTVMCVGVKNTTIGSQRETIRKAFNMADAAHSTYATVAIVISAGVKTYPYAAIYFIRAEQDQNP